MQTTVVDSLVMGSGDQRGYKDFSPIETARIRARLIALRDEHGSQAAAQRATGISQQMYSKIINGGNVGLGIARNLAEHLGITLEELIAPEPANGEAQEHPYGDLATDYPARRKLRETAEFKNAPKEAQDELLRIRFTGGHLKSFKSWQDDFRLIVQAHSENRARILEDPDTIVLKPGGKRTRKGE